ATFFLATGHWIPGAVLSIVGLGLAALFMATARRLPQGRLARAATGSSDGARRWAWFAWVSLASWLSAGREGVRLRGRQHRLRREQRELVRALGEAVYRDDEQRAEKLKTEARARGEEIDTCARQLRLALEAARERVGRERVTIQPTQALAGEP